MPVFEGETIMMYAKTVGIQDCADIASKHGYVMITGWNGFSYLAEIVDMETNELVAKGIVKDSNVHFVGNFCVDVKEWKFVKVDSHMITVTAKDIMDKLGDKCEIQYVNGEFHVYLKPYSNYICSVYFKSLDDQFNIQSNSALWQYFVK